MKEECIFCTLFNSSEYKKPLYNNLDSLKTFSKSDYESNKECKVIYRDQDFIIFKPLEFEDTVHLLISPIECVPNYLEPDFKYLEKAKQLSLILTKALGLNTVRSVYNYNDNTLREYQVNHPKQFKELRNLYHQKFRKSNFNYQEVYHAHLHLIGNFHFQQFKNNIIPSN